MTTPEFVAGTPFPVTLTSLHIRTFFVWTQ
jgi:hypothetical protein